MLKRIETLSYSIANLLKVFGNCFFFVCLFQAHRCPPYPMTELTDTAPMKKIGEMILEFLLFVTV